MRRSATDVLRRGLENVVANWPLLLIRVAEGMVMLAVVFGAIFAAIVPVAVSIGIHGFEPPQLERVEDIAALLISKWVTILWILIAITGALLVGLIVHSFVEAGNAAVYVEGEKAPVFRVFTTDRWLAGARRGLWPVFWIYNAAWAVGMVLMLIPLLVVGLLVAMFRTSAAAVVIGCFGLAVSVMFIIVVAVATQFWAQKAIVVAAARSVAATDALNEASREIRADLARHAAVVVVIVAISMGGLMFFSMLSMMSSSDTDWLRLAFMPMQMAMSAVQTAFSAVMGAWLLACLAALTVDRPA